MKAQPEKVADKRLRHDVEQQLEYSPEVTSTAIGVAVEAGVVTLTGYIDTYTEKLAAEHAAHKTYGVKAVANDLVIRPVFMITDTDLAAAAAAALKMNAKVPNTVEVTVKNGKVYLDGIVEWGFQKDAARDAVNHLAGATGVMNRIEVKPPVSASGVKEKIEEAFRRHAELDARRLTVTVAGSSVDLWGNVDNLSEKAEAEKAAWAAPGVDTVHNHLQVVP
jgi:osmotically-inducible protein OsmY